MIDELQNIHYVTCVYATPSMYQSDHWWQLVVTCPSYEGIHSCPQNNSIASSIHHNQASMITQIILISCP